MLTTDIVGLLENIGRINPYLPLFEAIINAIQSIEESGRKDGEIIITTIRPQMAIKGAALPEIEGFTIEDNGVGFNKENFSSFQTAYSQKKFVIGGKGFGRFTFLKVFSKVEIESTYEEDKKKKKIEFSFWTKDNGVSTPQESELSAKESVRTIVKLLNKKPDKTFEKQIETIARKIVEHFLLYFAQRDVNFPKITIKDDEEGSIELNKYFESNEDIVLLSEKELPCKKDTNAEKFTLKIFKIFYSPEPSSISLSAHKREVTSTALSGFIPEFHKQFTEQRGEDGTAPDNYTIKAYVLGNYLNENISLERNKFNFPKDKPDALYPFTQKDIETEVATHLRKEFQELIKQRYENKIQRIEKYIDDKEPWYKSMRSSLDLSVIPEAISDSELQTELHHMKSSIELKVKLEAKEIVASEDIADAEKVSKLVETITDIGKTDLIHYVANRKIILDLFEKSLKLTPEGKYESEDAVHGIIFPTKEDSTSIPYDSHNLWLLDERLNFHSYLASDKPLADGSRPDIVVFEKAVAMREGNEPTNPVIIFEFKKPQKDTFKKDEDGARTDDPVKQIADYAAQLRADKVLTPDGRQMKIHPETTPIYGFIICDLTPKARSLFKSYSLIPSPDNEGYFGYHSGWGIYYEVMSFDKMLKDANLRNKIFFRKLGID